MTYENIINDWNEKTMIELASLKEKMKPTIDKYEKLFKNEIHEDIPQLFGDFLYASLGDRVTGQRSSTLNMEYFENKDRGKALVEMATKNGRTIEDELKVDYKQNSYSMSSSYYRSNKPHLSHLTAGRKFGVSYLTGDGNRVHTMYFGSGSCFRHLKQGHVDCIKNKDKKELTQIFMDYKTEFISGIEKFTNNLITLDEPIPIKYRDLSVMEKTNKINRTYGTSTSSIVMGDEVEHSITHLYLTTTILNLWDGVSYLDSRTIKSDRSNNETFVGLVFLNINDDNNTITILGNIDMDADGVYTSISCANNPIDSNILFRSRWANHWYRISDAKGIKEEYRGYNNTKLGGFISNMDEVLTNKNVSDTLDEVVGFYSDMSLKLDEIKHENPTLFFLNGDM